MSLKLQVNGIEREFEQLASGASVLSLVVALGSRQDRVAIEQNGEILPRTQWPVAAVHDGDKLEIVHFVGGGTSSPSEPVSITRQLP